MSKLDEENPTHTGSSRIKRNVKSTKTAEASPVKKKPRGRLFNGNQEDDSSAGSTNHNRNAEVELTAEKNTEVSLNNAALVNGESKSEVVTTETTVEVSNKKTAASEESVTAGKNDEAVVVENSTNENIQNSNNEQLAVKIEDIRENGFVESGVKRSVEEMDDEDLSPRKRVSLDSGKKRNCIIM